MAAFYHDFTTNRTTAPDLVSLITAIHAVTDSSAGISEIGLNLWRAKKSTEFSQADINACQNAIDTAPTISTELNAQNVIDNMPIFEKAFLLTLLDQINVLRNKAGLATVTPAQAIQAVRDKAGTL